MSDWPTRAFRDIFSLKQGKYLKKDEMIPEPNGDWDIPVYGANGIIGYTDQLMYTERVPLVSCRGANCGVTHLTHERCWVSNNSIACLSDEADARFFYHVFRATSFSDVTGGSAQPQITLTSLGPKQIVCPPKETQKSIAAILGAYDDLIEVNRRRAAALEEMARGLFEEWFIRFRFPGHEDVPIVDTPDGPLPEGWEWGKFSQIAPEVRETLSPSSVDAETPYVGLEHFPRRSTTLSDRGAASDVDSTKARFRRGDILFGKIRPYFHKVIWAPFDGISSTDAIIWRPDPRFAARALQIASSDAFVAHSVQTSNGTKMPRANSKVLASYPCATPSAYLSQRFEGVVMPMVEQAAVLQKTNEQLAASRDLLLPRLISGQLSVKVAERELEDAA